MLAPKREKMACQRSMAQKKERKRGNHVSKKRETGMIQERKAIISRSKPYSSIYPSIHTLAPFDRDCMTCFSMDPLFGFTIYRIQVCPVLSYLELHKDECLERVILGVLPCFQKSLKKYHQMDCGSMNK